MLAAEVTLPPAQQPEHKLLVLNLTARITEQHIREIFGQFGTITRLELVNTSKSDSLASKAYVCFETRKMAESAAKMMHNGVIDNVNIQVSFVGARPRRERDRHYSPARWGRRDSRDRGRYVRGRRDRSRSPRRRSPIREERARSRSKSPRRDRNVRRSRSPVRRVSRSPERRSRSPIRVVKRNARRSPVRRSRSPVSRKRSKSPRDARKSRSPVSRRSRSPVSRRRVSPRHRE